MLQVRPARPDEAAEVAALSRRVFVDTFVAGFGIAYDPAELEAFLAKGHGAEAVAAFIADPDKAVWVAEADGVLAGFAMTCPMSLPHPDATTADAELYRLYVPREFHGGGVGPALMEPALAWMIARPAQWIGVWSENHRAQRFYARYGFEKAGEYDYPVGRTIDREFILRRG